MIAPFSTRSFKFSLKGMFRRAVFVHPDDRDQTDFDLLSFTANWVENGANQVFGYSKYGLSEEGDPKRNRLHVQR